MRILTLLTIAVLFIGGHEALAQENRQTKKLRQDRERLIKVVTDLEVDFAKTLANFEQLYQDYAKLAAKPVLPDQGILVNDLEKQLAAAATKIREMQRLEKKNDEERDAKLTVLKKDLNNQINHLKVDLARERAAVRLAQTQLSEVRTLQIEARKVEEMLRTEIIGRSNLQAKVQTLRGERDALLLQLQERMTQLGAAQESFSNCEARIASLEKSNRELMTSLAQREVEIVELKKHLADGKKRKSTVKSLVAEKAALKERLTKQRAEIDSLKKEVARAKVLAATVQRLEVDQKSYAKELKKRDTELTELRESAMKNKEHLASVKKLEEEKAALNIFLKQQQKEIARFRKELVNHKALSEKLVLAERGMTMAKDKIREGEETISTLKTALAAEKKTADQHFTNLKVTTEKNRATTLKLAALEKDKTRLQNELSKRETELKKAMTAAVDESKFIAAQAAAAAKVTKITKEKEELAAQLAKRDADLKKVRMDLGKLHLESEASKNQMHALKVRFAKVDSVRYALGAADVRDQQARVLRDVQEVLTMFPSARFEIVGHTCDLGSQEGNLRLSKERAVALIKFLVQNGVKADLLASRGVADAEPLVPNVNEANRRRNRRVEIHILD